MAMNDGGTNQSAATTTTTTSAASTNQSTTANTATNSVETTQANQSEEFDIGKLVDEEWGLTPKEPDEASENNSEDTELNTEGEDQGDSGEENPADEGDQNTEENTADGDTGEEKPQTLRVNYLGKAYDLPEDDARKYAQIGMNAGRLQEKYDALKPLEKLKDAIEVMALFRNQDPQGMINELADMKGMRDTEIKVLVDQGTDESVASALFDSRIGEARKNHELAKMQRSKSKGLTEYQKEDIANFAKVYPKEHENISAGKPIPDDVLTMWRDGTPLVAAWTIYENKGVAKQYGDANKRIKDLETELDSLKKDKANLLKNAENKTKAPTSKKGTGGGAGHADIFAGWDKY